MSRNIKIEPWDASNFLENQEDVDIYLEVAFETGDPKLITKALINAAKARGVFGTTKEQPTFNENDNPSLLALTTVIDLLGYQLSIIPKDREEATVV